MNEGDFEWDVVKAAANVVKHGVIPASLMFDLRPDPHDPRV
jgi:hypothetical protein